MFSGHSLCWPDMKLQQSPYRWASDRTSRWSFLKTDSTGKRPVPHFRNLGANFNEQRCEGRDFKRCSSIWPLQETLLLAWTRFFLVQFLNISSRAPFPCLTQKKKYWVHTGNDLHHFTERVLYFWLLLLADSAKMLTWSDCMLKITWKRKCKDEETRLYEERQKSRTLSHIDTQLHFKERHISTKGSFLLFLNKSHTHRTKRQATSATTTWKPRCDMTVRGLVSRSSGEKAQHVGFLFPFLLLVRELHLLTFEVRSEAAGAAPTSTEASTTSDPGGADLPLPAGGAASGRRARGPCAQILHPQTRTNICRVSTAALTIMQAAHGAMFWFASFLSMSRFGFRPRRMIWGFVCFFV